MHRRTATPVRRAGPGPGDRPRAPAVVSAPAARVPRRNAVPTDAARRPPALTATLWAVALLLCVGAVGLLRAMTGRPWRARPQGPGLAWVAAAAGGRHADPTPPPQHGLDRRRSGNRPRTVRTAGPAPKDRTPTPIGALEATLRDVDARLTEALYLPPAEILSLLRLRKKLAGQLVAVRPLLLPPDAGSGHPPGGHLRYAAVDRQEAETLGVACAKMLALVAEAAAAEERPESLHAGPLAPQAFELAVALVEALLADAPLLSALLPGLSPHVLATGSLQCLYPSRLGTLCIPHVCSGGVKCAVEQRFLGRSWLSIVPSAIGQTTRNDSALFCSQISRAMTKALRGMCGALCSIRWSGTRFGRT